MYYKWGGGGGEEQLEEAPGGMRLVLRGASHSRMVVAGNRSQGSGLGCGSRWGWAGSGCNHCPMTDLIQSLSRASSEKARAGWSTV